MTREDILKAIEIGESLKADYDSELQFFIRVSLEALKSIEALEQEPCEDAVSRRAINNLRKYNLVGGISTISLKDINKLPSVNPQEPCEDAISRQKVQDYIAKYLSQYLYEDVRQAIETIDTYIGDMPSVNPQEQKTDVLDKIKAEIREKITHYEHFSSSITANGLQMAIDIIDKHIEAESEASE